MKKSKSKADGGSASGKGNKKPSNSSRGERPSIGGLPVKAKTMDCLLTPDDDDDEGGATCLVGACFEDTDDGMDNQSSQCNGIPRRCSFCCPGGLRKRKLRCRKKSSCYVGFVPGCPFKPSACPNNNNPNNSFQSPRAQQCSAEEAKPSCSSNAADIANQLRGCVSILKVLQGCVQSAAQQQPQQDCALKAMADPCSPRQLPDMCAPRPEVCSPRPEMCSPRPDMRSPRPEMCSPRPEVCSPRPEMCCQRQMPEMRSARQSPCPCEMFSVQRQQNPSCPCTPVYICPIPPLPGMSIQPCPSYLANAQVGAYPDQYEPCYEYRRPSCDVGYAESPRTSPVNQRLQQQLMGWSPDGAFAQEWDQNAPDSSIDPEGFFGPDTLERKLERIFTQIDELFGEDSDERVRVENALGINSDGAFTADSQEESEMGGQGGWEDPSMGNVLYQDSAMFTPVMEDSREFQGDEALIDAYYTPSQQHLRGGQNQPPGPGKRSTAREFIEQQRRANRGQPPVISNIPPGNISPFPEPGSIPMSVGPQNPPVQTSVTRLARFDNPYGNAPPPRPNYSGGVPMTLNRPGAGSPKASSPSQHLRGGENPPRQSAREFVQQMRAQRGQGPVMEKIPPGNKTAFPTPGEDRIEMSIGPKDGAPRRTSITANARAKPSYAEWAAKNSGGFSSPGMDYARADAMRRPPGGGGQYQMNQQGARVSPSAGQGGFQGGQGGFQGGPGGFQGVQGNMQNGRSTMQGMQGQYNQWGGGGHLRGGASGPPPKRTQEGQIQPRGQPQSLEQPPPGNKSQFPSPGDDPTADKNGRQPEQYQPSFILWSLQQNPDAVIRGADPKMVEDMRKAVKEAKGINNVPPGGNQGPTGGKNVSYAGDKVPPGGVKGPPGGFNAPPGGFNAPPGGFSAPPGSNQGNPQPQLVVQGGQKPGGFKGHQFIPEGYIENAQMTQARGMSPNYEEDGNQTQYYTNGYIQTDQYPAGASRSVQFGGSSQYQGVQTGMGSQGVYYVQTHPSIMMTSGNQAGQVMSMHNAHNQYYGPPQAQGNQTMTKFLMPTRSQQHLRGGMTFFSGPEGAEPSLRGTQMSTPAFVLRQEDGGSDRRYENSYADLRQGPKGPIVAMHPDAPQVMEALGQVMPGNPMLGHKSMANFFINSPNKSGPPIVISTNGVYAQQSEPLQRLGQPPTYIPGMRCGDIRVPIVPINTGPPTEEEARLFQKMARDYLDMDSKERDSVVFSTLHLTPTQFGTLQSLLENNNSPSSADLIFSMNLSTEQMQAFRTMIAGHYMNPNEQFLPSLSEFNTSATNSVTAFSRHDDIRDDRVGKNMAFLRQLGAFPECTEEQLAEIVECLPYGTDLKELVVAFKRRPEIVQHLLRDKLALAAASRSNFRNFGTKPEGLPLVNQGVSARVKFNNAGVQPSQPIWMRQVNTGTQGEARAVTPVGVETEPVEFLPDKREMTPDQNYQTRTLGNRLLQNSTGDGGAVQKPLSRRTSRQGLKLSSKVSSKVSRDFPSYSETTQGLSLSRTILPPTQTSTVASIGQPSRSCDLNGCDQQRNCLLQTVQQLLVDAACALAQKNNWQPPRKGHHRGAGRNLTSINSDMTSNIIKAKPLPAFYGKAPKKSGICITKKKTSKHNPVGECETNVEYAIKAYKEFLEPSGACKSAIDDVLRVQGGSPNPSCAPSAAIFGSCVNPASTRFLLPPSRQLSSQRSEVGGREVIYQNSNCYDQPNVDDCQSQMQCRDGRQLQVPFGQMQIPDCYQQQLQQYCTCCPQCCQQNPCCRSQDGDSICGDAVQLDQDYLRKQANIKRQQQLDQLLSARCSSPDPRLMDSLMNNVPNQGEHCASPSWRTNPSEQACAPYNKGPWPRFSPNGTAIPCEDSDEFVGAPGDGLSEFNGSIPRQEFIYRVPEGLKSSTQMTYDNRSMNPQSKNPSIIPTSRYFGPGASQGPASRQSLGPSAMQGVPSAFRGSRSKQGLEISSKQNGPASGRSQGLASDQSFGPGSGQGFGPGSGQGFGPGSGHGVGSASGQGLGSASGQGFGSASGQGLGSASGPGIGSASVQGAGSTLGQGTGPSRQGMGSGSGQGFRPASGEGFGSASGQGIGSASDSGKRPSGQAMGPSGPGLGSGSGLGLGSASAANSGQLVRPASGQNLGPGSKQGQGTGQGFGPASGQGPGPAGSRNPIPSSLTFGPNSVQTFPPDATSSNTMTVPSENMLVKDSLKVKHAQEVKTDEMLHPKDPNAPLRATPSFHPHHLDLDSKGNMASQKSSEQGKGPTQSRFGAGTKSGSSINIGGGKKGPSREDQMNANYGSPKNNSRPHSRSASRSSSRPGSPTRISSKEGARNPSGTSIGKNKGPGSNQKRTPSTSRDDLRPAWEAGSTGSRCIDYTKYSPMWGGNNGKLSQVKRNTSTGSKSGFTRSAAVEKSMSPPPVRLKGGSSASISPPKFKSEPFLVSEGSGSPVREAPVNKGTGSGQANLVSKDGECLVDTITPCGILYKNCLKLMNEGRFCPGNVEDLTKSLQRRKSPRRRRRSGVKTAPAASALTPCCCGCCCCTRNGCFCCNKDVCPATPRGNCHGGAAVNGRRRPTCSILCPSPKRKPEMSGQCFSQETVYELILPFPCPTAAPPPPTMPPLVPVKRMSKFSSNSSPVDQESSSSGSNPTSGASGSGSVSSSHS